MKITPKDFPYDTDVVSKKFYDEHLKLYKGYVEKINQIYDELRINPGYAGAGSAWSHFRGLKTGETFCMDGVILHELYFQNINGHGANGKKPEPGPRTMKLIRAYFGTYENWAEDMTACGKAARGWALLSYEQRSRRCANTVQDSHDDGVLCTAYPLLALDMYEHAYYGDYGADKGKYIANFLDGLNWDAVEARAARLPEEF
ncbi:MAG: superoxide dismutase [Firmicutes bacterium]|nr:superoxide dismutase [Bacillota bacterium]